MMNSHGGALPVHLSAATHFVCMRLRAYAFRLTYHMKFIVIFVRFSLIFTHSKKFSCVNGDNGDNDTLKHYDQIKNLIHTLLHLTLILIVCTDVYTVTRWESVRPASRTARGFYIC